MSPTRQLIVNADDFGLSDGVNQGIITAHATGIVTSTSLMVRMPGAARAVRAAREHPQLSLGIHLDLGEWFYDGAEWLPRYERAPLGDDKKLRAEVGAQLKMFEDMVGAKPSHIDSHQHAHRNEPLSTIVRSLSAELNIPLRHFNETRYLGDFYGQDEKGDTYPERVRPEFLIGLIKSLEPGLTELCCHPAAFVDFDSTYATERITELESLCDPSVASAIQEAGVELVSFSDLARPH